MTFSSFYIYIPRKFWPTVMPESPDENWPGFGLGMYTWTIQTYLRLHAAGFPCQLVNRLPEQGIILVDHNHLRATRLRPSARQFIVCLKQDGLPYPYAQYHIVQNPEDARTHPRYHYIPHWPQPGLIGRDDQRGDRFETIAFFGHSLNLAPELQGEAWQRALADLGLHWRPIINQNHWSQYQQLDARWNNYSQIDAVVAVRQFGQGEQFLHKPATKLYNAWLAKVPAILGYESAFRSEGQPGDNYLEVTTPTALFDALKRLKADARLRACLVHQGWLRGQQFRPQVTVQRWQFFLEQVAVPAYETWCRHSRSTQQAILEMNWLRYKMTRGMVRVGQLLSTA